MDVFPIYLVDDDTKHLLLLKDHLESRLPFRKEISIFSSGENCLQKMAEQVPWIVVLDYHLDGIRPDAANGLEILRKIKRQYPGVDVIMMSAQDQLKVGLETLDAGATDYVIKGETAMLRVQLILHQLLERRSMDQWRDKQESKMRWLYLLVVLLVVGMVAMAVFAI